MFTLDDTTGAITIDFSVPSAEVDAEPEVVHVVVMPPPSFGAYKRIRSELNNINRGRDELMKELQADDDVGLSEMTSRVNAFTEDGLLGWWKLVMAGDASYRGQATSPPPDDIDTWPLYLVNTESMQEAMGHWKTVPLARGAQPAPTTS